MAWDDYKDLRPLKEWPIPFGGIEYVYSASNKEGLMWLIKALMNCGHKHNYAVETDESFSVHVSSSGRTCIGIAIMKERERRG